MWQSFSQVSGKIPAGKLLDLEAMLSGAPDAFIAVMRQWMNVKKSANPVSNLPKVWETFPTVRSVLEVLAVNSTAVCGWGLCRDSCYASSKYTVQINFYNFFMLSPLLLLCWWVGLGIAKWARERGGWGGEWGGGGRERVSECACLHTCVWVYLCVWHFFNLNHA